MTVQELRRALEKIPGHFEVRTNPAADWAYIDVLRVDFDLRTEQAVLMSSGAIAREEENEK